ncbi:MAG: MalT-like region [Acidobacteriota bacterium]|jgi:tetratricopeptide (TPR) repeat protein|nr:MalT-like region [Acidobacteriota bacterium]
MTGERQTASGGLLRRGELAVFAGRMALERDRESGAALAAAVLADERPVEAIPWPELQELIAPLAEQFLQRSSSLRYSDPAGMIRDAEAARKLAFLVPPLRYGRRVTADLRARVLAEVGNAYRVADDLDTAGDILAEAAAWARRGTGDPRLLARIGDLSASLHADNRRFGEAIAMLERVRSFYEQLGDYHRAGRALISQGMYTRESGRPLEAISLFAYGLKCLEPGRDSNLELTAVHGLAYCLHESGCSAQARELLLEKRHLYERLAEPLKMIRLRWLEGKIAFALQEDAEAEGAFREARSKFIREQQSFDAALVSLDLALVLTKHARRHELVVLVDGMVSTFRRLKIRREGFAALILLQRVCQRPVIEAEALSARIRATAALLEQRSR